ncbi:MAG: hypothetical protein IT299_01205 [Dehalococcoidia bacterium]|nr:hypothetical protein [Dehalococcoidia bacterium]
MRAGVQASVSRSVFPALALFGLLAGAYGWSIDLRATRGASITGDEPFYLLTTQSLIRDGDLDLRNQYQWQSYREFFDHAQPLWLQSADRPGEALLSPHAPGLSVYLVPGFAAGGLRGVQVQLLLTAALAYALAYLLIARSTGHRLWPWLATVGVGLTAPAFVYATEVYPEVPASLCLVASLIVLAVAPRGSRVGALLLAVMVSALAWLGAKYVPLGAVIGLAAVWHLERRDARAIFLGASVLSGAAYVGWHLATYGALTAYSASWAWADAGTTEVLVDHLSLWERAYRLTGVFVDERFGLGRWAPVLLLTLPAVAVLLLRPGVPRVAVALVVVQLLLASLVALTMMGWWFPGRTMVATFPLIAWALAELILRVPGWARCTLGALEAYSIAVTIALVAAARSGEVVIAVDPFALSSTLWHATAGLFPDYRHWSAATVALHTGWTSAFIVGSVLGLARGRPRAAARRAVARWRTHLAAQRNRVGPEQDSAGVPS